MSPSKPSTSEPEDELVFYEDNPEWTAEDFKRAKPFEDVFSEADLAVLRKAMPKMRGPQKAEKKIPVSLRLTPEVVERFKADGPGWQSRMDEALKKAVGL